MEQKDKKGVSWPHIGRVGLSVFNGVIGDYLDAHGNPLATKMGFYAQRKRVSLSHESLTHYPYALNGKLVVMLHGLTNLETIWNISKEGDAEDDNYGTRIHHRYGHTPFFLRYNSGLEIKANGLSFSQAMSELIEAYPEPIEEVVLIGFSMGGLIIRHALHDASLAHLPWVKKVAQTYYLGSPHEGAPLEKFGTIASSVLRQMPQAYISHWADVVDVRSRGIKDLKHGLVADEFACTHNYAQNHNLMDDDCVHVPESIGSAYGFPPQIRHHFVSGSVGKENQTVLNFLVGDIMVRTPSALPEGAPDGSPAAHFFGVPHLKLANSESVYVQLESWMDDEYEVTSLPPRAVIARPIGQSSGRMDADHLKGTIKAVGAGFEQLINTVQLVHMAIANEPFAVLDKVLVTKVPARAVKEVHHGIANVIYDSLKLSGKLVQKSGASLAECLADKPMGPVVEPKKG